LQEEFIPTILVGIESTAMKSSWDIVDIALMSTVLIFDINQCAPSVPSVMQQCEAMDPQIAPNPSP
jgi:hypothetical protein